MQFQFLYLRKCIRSGEQVLLCMYDMDMCPCKEIFTDIEGTGDGKEQNRRQTGVQSGAGDMPGPEMGRLCC